MNPLRRIVNETRALNRIAGARVSARFLCQVAFRLPTVIATRSLAPANGGVPGRVHRLRVMGRPILMYGELLGGARELYGRAVYCTPCLSGIATGDTVIDLGANYGLFSVLAAILGAQVIAVEAQFGFLAEIRRLAALNGCGARIKLEWAAVGAGQGQVSEGECWRSMSHAQEKKPPLATLNELLKRHRVARIDFLKCDIEGSEFALFARDTQWLKIVRQLAMEVHPHWGEPREIIGVLESAGFQVAMVDRDLRPAASAIAPAYLYGTKA